MDYHEEEEEKAFVRSLYVRLIDDWLINRPKIRLKKDDFFRTFFKAEENMNIFLELITDPRKHQLLDDIEGDDETAATSAKKNLRDNLTAIAPAFIQKPYFMSDDYTLIDCLIAPLLWRLDLYGVKLPSSAKIIGQYAESLFEREAFKIGMSEFESELNI